ncbi:uncharacterized protein LOC112082046 [Eutrema salsugineum]|uniref:uncharacterized protein LOC112082046 n=1 Tax=Eutrema salsugineum TaxID=72664 RepID=UPI000CED17B7|nr:uncharacterized protein LOC112082046 [Eutrema salsugineum]
MSNLAKLEITALDISENNYMRWAVAAKMHLKGMQLFDTIDKSETTSEEKKKYVILPKARHEWLNLRFQDYKSIGEYDSALFGITSKMMLCGTEQQNRAKGYKKYSELMQVLLVAEQNKELVMLNHQSRPTGSAPLPEVNFASSNDNNWQQGRGRGRGYNRGRGRGYGYGRGRGYGRGHGRGKRSHSNDFTNEKNNKIQRNEDGQEMNKQYDNTTCYRCDMKGHWFRSCRTPKHLADLYQESQKTKGKEGEANFIHGEPGPSFDGISDTHLDIADFMVDPEDINKKQNN